MQKTLKLTANTNSKHIKTNKCCWGKHTVKETWHKKVIKQSQELVKIEYVWKQLNPQRLQLPLKCWLQVIVKEKIVSRVFAFNFLQLTALLLSWHGCFNHCRVFWAIFWLFVWLISLIICRSCLFYVRVLKNMSRNLLVWFQCVCNGAIPKKGRGNNVCLPGMSRHRSGESGSLQTGVN